MMTCLQATNDVSKYVTELLNETAKYNITRFHKFLDHGLEVDSYRETLENLRQFQRRYRDKDDTTLIVMTTILMKDEAVLICDN